MSVDKFGRHTLKNRGPAGRTGIGFNLDTNGNFDISDKKITNLCEPTNKSDATTKKYVDSIFADLSKQIIQLNVLIHKQSESIKYNIQIVNELISASNNKRT